MTGFVMVLAGFGLAVWLARWSRSAPVNREGRGRTCRHTRSFTPDPEPPTQLRRRQLDRLWYIDGDGR